MEATRAGSVNAELDLLAALMKVGRPGASDNFKLNLFGDGAEDLETSGAEAEQVGCCGMVPGQTGYQGTEHVAVPDPAGTAASVQAATRWASIS
jgi:hypothetical protein